MVDATGSMQNVIDDMKHRLDDLVFTMQRLVPTARIGAVAYRDRDDGKIATAPRQSEDFLVKWTDLTFKGSKVKDFLDGIVAEGGGDWEEAVKDGFEAAMKQLKWRAGRQEGDHPGRAARRRTSRTSPRSATWCRSGRRKAASSAPST